MKKVLIFSLSYYPYFTSGAEAAIKEITDRISDNDIKFHMVTLRYDSALPKIEKIGNVLVHRIGIVTKSPTFEDLSKMPLHINKPLFQFLAALKAMSLHRKHNYDGIWAMMAHSSGVPSAIFKMFNPSVSYVLTLQEGDPPEHIERVMRPLWPLFKRSFTKADKVQVISSFLGDWAKRMGFKGSIELVHNGANPRDFKDDIPRAELESLKQKLGKKEGDIFLVNTARLVHQKANDDTIRALVHLPKHIKLLAVGAGSDSDMLKELSKKLNVSNRVIFTGKVDRSEVTKYRRVSDIFVGPSRSEGLGNAFLSAMASGLPVVATQEGGIAEFLFDSKRNPDKPTTGFAVDKDSPQQIADVIKYILKNKDEVKKVTDNAYKQVSQEYNWDKVAKKMKDNVFDVVLNKQL